MTISTVINLLVIGTATVVVLRKVACENSGILLAAKVHRGGTRSKVCLKASLLIAYKNIGS